MTRKKVSALVLAVAPLLIGAGAWSYQSAALYDSPCRASPTGPACELEAQRAWRGIGLVVAGGIAALVGGALALRERRKPTT